MKILLCTDGSKYSQKALEEASEIVKGCNVNEVAIIHVHERYEPLPTLPNESIKWIMQKHKKEGEKILSEALKFIKGKNI